MELEDVIILHIIQNLNFTNDRDVIKSCGFDG